jgi:hypothetical protein
MRSFVFCSSLLLTVASAVAQSATVDAPLWNGKDLSGWHGQRTMDPVKFAAMPADKRGKLLAEDAASVAKHWRCEDGELINDGHGAFLTTDKEYGDAVFELEYKTVAKADSGIYLRETPQVQIWDYTEAGGKWNIGADKGSGGLWNNKNNERFPPACYDKPFGEWNRMSIMIIGERVWVTLNNHTTVNGVRMENYWDRTKPMPKQGRLQLQTHGGEIRFRNMSVRVLDGESANQFLASSDFHAYMPAFNGTDFTGWQGATDNYEIVDGAIRCKQGKGGNLFTNEVYQDFSVRCQFKVPPGGNNGLAMRYPGKGDPAYAGFELQVLDNTAKKYANLKPYQYHGSAYGMAPALRGYQRPVGQWNFQEVTMIGSRVTVELNGFLILDADLKDLKSNLPKHVGKDNPAGHFGFCGHNDAVSFRDIRIRGL